MGEQDIDGLKGIGIQELRLDANKRGREHSQDSFFWNAKMVYGIFMTLGAILTVLCGGLSNLSDDWLLNIIKHRQVKVK